MTAPNFTGFEPGAFAFFEALAANNDRDWFLAHKAQYERDLKAPMMDLVADLNSALAARETPLSGDPRKALFRIHRDVRFARDKRPYKTHISAALSREGDKRSQGLLYLQLGADERFAAAGFYGLEPPQLAHIRDRIVARPDAWRAATTALGAAGLELSTQHTAVRLPRGYDATVGDLAQAVKLKAFIVSRPLTMAEVCEASLVKRLAAFAQSAMPLLTFGWRALETP